MTPLHAGVELLRVGPRHFVLRDPRSGEAFHLGATERVLVDLVAAEGSPESVARECRRRTGAEIDPRTVREFVEQLRTLGLLDPALPAAPGAQQARSAAPEIDAHVSPRAQALNTFLDWIAVAFGWAFHPLTAVAIAALSLVGATAVIHGWDRYLAQLEHLMDTVPLPLLAMLSLAKTFFLVNAPREAAVGVACRKYGGRVHGFRVHWLLNLVPFLHCELGDSVAQLHGRARWTTLTAGLWCQTAIGAFAALGWGMADPRSDLSTIFLLLLPACLAHMLLHAMIFLRFDCYRLLCAVLDDWRLRERALAETSAWLGRRTSPEPLMDRERFWLRAYGAGYHAFVWLGSAVLVIGGLWWLESRMGPNGLLLGLAIALWGYQGEIAGWLGSTALAGRCRTVLGAKRARRLLTALFVLLCGAVLLWPYELDVAGRCRTLPAAEAGVRARTAGVVRAIHVHTGDEVQAGATLFTLDNPELVRERDEARAALARERAELTWLRNGARPEDIRIAEAQLHRARANLAHAQVEVTRDEHLLAERAASQQSLAQSRNRRDRRATAVAVAGSSLDLLRHGTRDETIAAQEAEVKRQAAIVEHREALVAQLDVTAPIAGRIDTPNLDARAGQAVQAGDLLALIRDPTPGWVEMAAPEDALLLVRPGLEATVRLSAMQGRALAGRVLSVAAAAESEGRFDAAAYRTDRETLSQEAPANGSARVVRVRLVLDQPDASSLAPGLTGFVRIRARSDRFYTALARAVLGYVRTDMWSWLP